MYNIEQLRQIFNKTDTTITPPTQSVVKTTDHTQLNLFLAWSVQLAYDNNLDIEVNDYVVTYPDRQISIEFLDLSDRSDLCGYGRSSFLNKTKEYESKGLRLIHLYENEWVLKKEVVKSRIRSLLQLNTRLYARKCKIVNLTNKDMMLFFNENHIQGSVSSPNMFGLEYKGEVVAAMTFGKSRFNKEIEYELVRYSNKINLNVIGGASRLFNYFVQTMNPNSIISYSDKRWNTGNLYAQLGYKYSHTADPNYFYFHLTDKYALKSRQSFQKHKLKDKLATFNPELTEWQNMVANNYDRIWDCGNSVWIWSKESST